MQVMKEILSTVRVGNLWAWFCTTSLFWTFYQPGELSSYAAIYDHLGEDRETKTKAFCQCLHMYIHMPTIMPQLGKLHNTMRHHLAQSRTTSLWFVSFFITQCHIYMLNTRLAEFIRIMSAVRDTISQPSSATPTGTQVTRGPPLHTRLYQRQKAFLIFIFFK